MGFLNNSGDIILDAVLTDTGRMRLAKGDGSFKISKFALADDEIDYSLFVGNTGSAYQDLQLLQTPILESFTNNASSMKSKLMTVNLKNILHLPVMEANPLNGSNYAGAIITNGFIVAVDKTTEDFFSTSGNTVNSIAINTGTGLLKGFSTNGSQIIRVDQGIDSTAVTSLPSELKETQYIVEMDNRLGVLLDKNYNQVNPSYVDDDDIASYFVSLTTDPSMVRDNPVSSIDTTTSNSGQVISGPRGTILEFGIEASLTTKTSTYMFDTIGSIYTGTRSPATSTLKTIFSNIIITGATTGYSITVPVVYAKLI
jgi:hypothetical protein